jgi:hypothetical protein
VSATEYAELDEWVVPDLGVEFADTLARFWDKERARLTPLMPDEAKQLIMFLDSFASVTVGTEL